MFHCTPSPTRLEVYADTLSRRAYASCGRMVEALYLQAHLVDTTSTKTPAYVQTLLISVTLLVLNLNFRDACAVLVPILNRLPPPLTRNDGLFFMAYINARQGTQKHAALLWLKCFGPTWPDHVNQPHVWNDCGRRWFAAGLWDIAAWMFGEGMPSRYSALHVVPMPVPAPNSTIVELFVRAVSYSTQPNVVHIDDLLTMAMSCTETKYNAGIRSLCVAFERHDITDTFPLQDTATRTIVRACRTIVTWRHHRAVYWMTVGAHAFQSYKRPRRVKKARAKQAIVKVAHIPPNIPPPVRVAPQVVASSPVVDPPPEDLLAVYGGTACDQGDFESRLRFILHRAKVIADTSASTTALTLDRVTPQWLKQLHAVRDMVRRDVYMTQWKAGVLRNLRAAVARMEGANGPTGCSRYGHALVQDIELCRVHNIQTRMDHLLHLATSEEATRNLAYFHLLHQDKPATTT
ncbi:hypothetical protein, variant 1 [Aphanomyces invadans]|uniref:Uncharacterized protein n=1 Tax=Aphanomyces invadans TaxID=157072 RepID=A0A024U5W4_9STRA|nr:hypothetical protein, variant 1 [Aphanomyces invadans]ETW01615.1 hypothetical protein, variant 1 [Aphanomyces invadans]|eukprot:XP_008869463.1 hypothetical protein, variant 1 [Aphanomyces invadans]